MENIDALWATIAAWTEDDADLGDEEEFGDGNEALSDDEDEDEGLCMRCDPRFGLFLRLRSGRHHFLWWRRPHDATRDAASRHTLPLTSNLHRRL